MVNETRLSTELWGHIFSFLQSDLGADSACLHHIPAHRFYGLPIVCRQFNTAFRQQPKLYQKLVLDQLPCTCLPDMISWIRLHHQDIKVLEAYCPKEILNTALTALQYQIPHLQRIVISELDNIVSMHLLSVFTSLTACAFHQGPPQGISLLPLRSLPNLANLYLEDGMFHQLNCLQHLTGLHLLQVIAPCSNDSEFASV